MAFESNDNLFARTGSSQFRWIYGIYLIEQIIGFEIHIWFHQWVSHDSIQFNAIFCNACCVPILDLISFSLPHIQCGVIKCCWNYGIAYGRPHFISTQTKTWSISLPSLRPKFRISKKKQKIIKLTSPPRKKMNESREKPVAQIHDDCSDCLS